MGGEGRRGKWEGDGEVRIEGRKGKESQEERSRKRGRN